MTINLTIYRMFGEGATYQQISEATGMTRQRVQQMCRPSIQLADMLKKRADGKCERCGILPHSPHIHHVDKTGLPLSNNPENLKKLLYVCPSCHRKEHTKTATYEPIYVERPKKPYPERHIDLEGAEIEILVLTCKRCIYDWIPRKENPIQCPRCKSLRWNEKKAEVAA